MDQHCDFGIYAGSLDINSIKDVELPPQEPDGRIKTLSNMGMATTNVLGLSEEFVEYASKCRQPVLDAGCAYGEASIAALKKGAKCVIANELQDDFFNIIVKDQRLNEDDRKRLYFKVGKMPDGIDFPENSLGAIHMSRVMHFFHPDEVERTFEKARKWLVPNGRFFILTASPYHYCTEGFGEVYEERYDKGEKWPGEVTDFTLNSGQQFVKKAPTYLHEIDPRVLVRVAEKYGFLIKKVALYGGEKDEDYTSAIFINRKK
ncbi:hypothetical protein M9Y10_040375 [Tritrichomonas musculus]|uniref:Methyltransferase domain-containing protein n=1 Tax=Tritrichomonas musculus TaxID=1915356 RepID=A0ABR2GQG8_9EUKA